MRVLEIATRRKGLAVLHLAPPPAEDISGAAYEKGQVLIDRVILARCDIQKGMELSEAELRELVLVSESYRAKQRAVWILSQGDVSRQALYDKLCRNFTEQAAAFAVSQMVQKGYLNDRAYAERLIVKAQEKQMSRRATQNRLFEKGIPANIITEVMGEANLQESEVERALALLQTKYQSKLSDEVGIRKAFAALQRRGFSYSDIKAALHRLQAPQQGEDYGI